MNARSFAFAVASILVSASTAYAGTPTELVQEGVALREKGDDKGALEKFREADTAAPSGEAKAQMALAEQALGRWSDAELHLKAALEDGTNAFVKRNRKPLEGALETIGKHLATISLVDLPEGALVALDDKDFAPALPSYRVSNGVHRFRGLRRHPERRELRRWPDVPRVGHSLAQGRARFRTPDRLRRQWKWFRKRQRRPRSASAPKHLDEAGRHHPRGRRRHRPRSGDFLGASGEFSGW